MLTDNEIIKALEYCEDSADTDKHCLKCPYCNESYCLDKMMADALSLINRQKAELDDLKRDDLPRCKDALRRANEIGMGLEKENQELRAEVAILRACKKQQMDEIKFLSASRLSMWDELNAHRIGYDKGVKEFAERLCEDRVSNDPVVIAVKTELKMMQKNGG